MSTANQILFNPAQLVLELKETIKDRAWEKSQSAANHSRWQSYLNQLVLATVLPWIQAEEDDTAKAGLDTATQADIWEVVNGTMINISGAKLVLIPSEAEDLSELRIPQEWIDIPELTADYYLSVQINVDAGYVRVWGYATHQRVKNQGNFNQGDRIYTLSDDELIADLDVLWVARELCPEEVTKAEVEPIAPIADAQAKNLIERLGSQSQLLPRLAVPFHTWAALIQNKDWLRNLAGTRRGVAPKTPVIQWLQPGISNLSASWRQIEIATSASGAKGVATKDGTIAGDLPVFGLAKQIAIADIPYELKILPLQETGAWRFELSCVTPGCTITPGFKLRLLTEDLEAFSGNEDVAVESVEQLFIEVVLDAGESLVCQIESTPNNYHSEVLQF